MARELSQTPKNVKRRAKAASRKSRGLCKFTNCVSEEAAPGHTMCRYHLNQKLEDARKVYRVRRDAGLCTINTCTNPPVEYQTRCQKHIDLYNMWRRNAYRRDKANGICVRHGCNNKNNGTELCTKHVAERAVTSKGNYDAKVEFGLCTWRNCKKDAEGGFKMCNEHRILKSQEKKSLPSYARALEQKKRECREKYQGTEPLFEMWYNSEHGQQVH